MIEPNGPGFPPAELRIATDGDMRDLGRRLAALLRAGDLVILAGPLGAGKTTLVQGIGAGLGVRGPVTSPTFVIARVHPPLAGGGPALVHADAYRLGSFGEVDDLDLDTDAATAVTVWSGARDWPNRSPRTAWRSRSSPIWTVMCGPCG
jgi:tRNA threonylcarbamoyladenosine biosynthesis protein TsaE